MADMRSSIDADVPVCDSPFVRNIVREYLRKSCRLILESLGEDAVAAIAVSGSAARGELTALTMSDSRTLILSDVDLSVVTKTEAQRERAKSYRPALLRSLRGLDESSLMCSPPEMGVYSLNDLEIQAPKMGVLEMRASGRVLWGDSDVLKRLPDVGAIGISKREAITLLYNRCFEQLHAAELASSNELRDAAMLLYAAAKSYIDAGTALAAYHGNYDLGYRQRLRNINTVLNRHHEDGLGALGHEEFSHGISFWTDFKLAPDLAAVAERFGLSREQGDLKELSRRAWMQAWVPLAEAWMALVALEGVRVAAGVPGTCRAMIGFESALDRMKGWKRLILAGEVPAGRAMRLVRAGSPLHLLRLCAFHMLHQVGTKVALGQGEGDFKLEADTSSFLETYFPAPAEAEKRGGSVNAWRRRVVGVRMQWRERYWS